MTFIKAFATNFRFLKDISPPTPTPREEPYSSEQNQKLKAKDSQQCISISVKQDLDYGTIRGY